MNDQSIMKKDRPRGSLIAGLDIGSSKMVCFIGRSLGDGRVTVDGIGHHASRGVKNGVIVNMDAARQSIARTVESAENMAGRRLGSIVVNMSARLTKSRHIRETVPVRQDAVRNRDIQQAMAAIYQVEQDNEKLIHVIPTRFTIDDQSGVQDPDGMYGDQLTVDIHGTTATDGTIKTLTNCLGQSHLEVEAICVNPYASGLACLVDDEFELGCTVIDIGAGTTDIGVFLDGRLLHADAIPVGGVHITNDIARGLSTPLAEAERMKTLYGNAIQSTSDDAEVIDVPLMGEDSHGAANHVPRSLLTGIIQPRVEELFELVRDKLETSGYDQVVGRRVVLTGGSSQLQGLRELAQLILDKQVRLADPMRADGLAGSTNGPGFSTAIGLLLYAAYHRDETPENHQPRRNPSTIIRKIFHWLKDNW